jgi:broad specificity phosphatase PhoE
VLNIYLARHGQDEDNSNSLLNGRRNMPLTPKGIEQAKELGQKIKGTRIKFNKIYSSPLIRAFKTAGIISESVEGLKPEKLDLLIERDFGTMTGKPQNQIEELCSPEILKTETITYFLSPEGAETFPQLIDRAKKLLEYLNERHKEGNILLVSHGDFGKMLYCAYYNLDWKGVLKTFHFGNAELLLMSPNSAPESVHVFHTEQHNL